MALVMRYVRRLSLSLSLDRQRPDDLVEARRGGVFDRVHYAFLFRLRRAQAISGGVSCAITLTILPWLLAPTCGPTWSSKQETKETRATIIAAIYMRRSGRVIRPPLLCTVGYLALTAFEDSDHPRISAIDVFAQLQLALLVHKRRLVGQVHWYKPRKVDIDLLAAEHLLQTRLTVVLVRHHQRQQLFGVGKRILNPHAAMAVGPPLARKQILVRRVMLVDQELVREIEADTTERVGSARWLPNMDATVAGVVDFQTNTIECPRIFLQRWKVLFFDDRLGHVPGWVDGDEFHIRANHRGR